MRKSAASIALIGRTQANQNLWLAQWNEAWQGYSFVGGHRRDDESFRDCLAREIEEELGLREGEDFRVDPQPRIHLQYTDVSRRTGEQTEYEIELFDVALLGEGARREIDVNPANRWLSEPEIVAEACRDGRPISPTPRRFLNALGWDLFVSYAHKDDEPDGWVTALIEAIRREHAEFTPTPLRVFFDRQEIRSMDDWQRKIFDGLHASKLMLAVLSEHYFRSDYCLKEWRLYRDNEIRREMLGESIAPIYIVTVPGFEGPQGTEQDEWRADLSQRDDMRRRQYLDVRPWRPHGVEALRRLEVRERLKCLDQQISERLARARRAEQSKTTVPRASDRFVGRGDELAYLRETLPQGKVAAITAVHGIGGIGKTALAFRYSQAFHDHYPGGRFLIKAAGLSDQRVALVRLAPDLGIELNEPEQRDLDLAAARVRTALERRDRSLLILDNVDQSELLWPRNRGGVLPATNGLHVLITSRMDASEFTGPGVACLPLDSLPEPDGLELLEQHRAIEGDDEWKAALRIVRQLGGHALALEIVAVYHWKHPEVSYSDYALRLEREGVFAALSGTGADRAMQVIEHPEALIGPLLEPTLAGLGEVERRALEYAALLPPDAVPFPWLRDLVVADLPDRLHTQPGYADPWRELERRLVGLRLWIRSDDDRVVRMHQIVQEVARARLLPIVLEVRRKKVQEYLLGRAKILNVSSEFGTSAWEIESLRDYAVAGMSRDDPAALQLSQWISDPLQSLNRLSEADILAQAAVSCCRRLVATDPDNSDWQQEHLVSLGKIGDVRWAQGDLSAALNAYRASLLISERLAESDLGNAGRQYDLSVSLGKIGDVQRAQGDFSAALSAYRASLLISERLAESDLGNARWQYNLSISLALIGDVHLGQGDLSAAIGSYRASLEIIQCLAEADPDNADCQQDLWASCLRLAAITVQLDQDTSLEWCRKAHDVLFGMKQRGMYISPRDEQLLGLMRDKLGI